MSLAFSVDETAFPDDGTKPEHPGGWTADFLAFVVGDDATRPIRPDEILAGPSCRGPIAEARKREASWIDYAQRLVELYGPHAALKRLNGAPFHTAIA